MPARTTPPMSSVSRIVRFMRRSAVRAARRRRSSGRRASPSSGFSWLRRSRRGAGAGCACRSGAGPIDRFRIVRQRSDDARFVAHRSPTAPGPARDCADAPAQSRAWPAPGCPATRLGERCRNGAGPRRRAAGQRAQGGDNSARMIITALRRGPTAGPAARRRGQRRFGNRFPERSCWASGRRPCARLRGRIGANHALALELWATGVHEARIIAALADDPKAVNWALRQIGKPQPAPAPRTRSPKPRESRSLTRPPPLDRRRRAARNCAPPHEPDNAAHGAHRRRCSGPADPASGRLPKEPIRFGGVSPRDRRESGPAMLESTFLYFPTHSEAGTDLQEWRAGGKLIGYLSPVASAQNGLADVSRGMPDRRATALCQGSLRNTECLVYCGIPGIWAEKRFGRRLDSINAAAVEAYALLRTLYPEGVPIGGVIGGIVGAAGRPPICALARPAGTGCVDRALRQRWRGPPASIFPFLPVGLPAARQMGQCRGTGGLRGRVIFTAHCRTTNHPGSSCAAARAGAAPGDAITK